MREKDHPARGRVQQPLAVIVGEGKAGGVEHDRAERQALPQSALSRITVAAAMPRSSVRVTWDLRICLCFNSFCS